MSASSRKELFWSVLGWIAVVPVVAKPISDPDLWWHLSAARWMVENRAWPRADWLSHTLAGKFWVDFEWLAQLIFYFAYSMGGLAGLWLLKSALLIVAASLVSSFLKILGMRPWEKALGLALWMICIIHRSDLRTELFSFCAFLLLARALEEQRRQLPGVLPILRGPFLALFFALWANCHAGFAYGLLLLLLYGIEAAVSGRNVQTFLAIFGLGVVGTLLNPYGIYLYLVLWQHATDIPNLSKHILDWRNLSFAQIGHAPAWILLAVTVLALARPWFRSKRPVFETCLLAVFAVLALRHARFIPYFASLAVPLVFRLNPAILSKRVCAGAVAACAVFALWCCKIDGTFKRIFNDRYVPIQSTQYLSQHPELQGRLYHAWGWGGYLGFRLGLNYKIFQDGRYIFHPFLEEAVQAVRSPSHWADFLDRRGIDIALLENIPLLLDMPRRYPDGSTHSFQRPFYLLYMPREDWALVHWDERALVFARRSAFFPEQLSRLEYRLARPHDEEALQDALARGEINPGLLEAERLRHQQEIYSSGITF